MNRINTLVPCLALCGGCLPSLPNLPHQDTDASSSSSHGAIDLETGAAPTTDPMPADVGSGASVGTTTIAGSTEESTSTDITSASYVPVPDMGVDLDDCSTWAQDCPAGYKCMPWADDGGNSWNDTRCTPLDGSPAEAGDPCTVEGSGVSGVDDCDDASMCWNVDPDTNSGTCTAFCSGSAREPSCADPATTCSISNQDILTLCLQVCDPLAQDCPTDLGCYPFDEPTDAFACTPDASNGEGQYPSQCEFLNACAPGNACVNADALPACPESCCSPYCDLSELDTCPDLDDALACRPWFAADQAPPGWENVGVCALPL